MTRYGVTREDSGADPWSTNNKMELQAPIEALSKLDEPSEVWITSDSKYVVNGMSKWIDAWKAADWHTSTGKPVANRDQWEKLDMLCQRHRVKWIWVAGHSGNPGNERCDYLASQQAGIQAGEEWLRRRNAQKRVDPQKPDTEARKVRQSLAGKVAGAEEEIRSRKEAGMSLRRLAKEYDVPRGVNTTIVKGRDLQEWVKGGNFTPSSGPSVSKEVQSEAEVSRPSSPDEIAPPVCAPKLSNNQNCHPRVRLKAEERSGPPEQIQAERYRGGTVCVVGGPARYKAGRGIAKVGDERSGHGPVKVLVRNGIPL